MKHGVHHLTMPNPPVEGMGDPMVQVAYVTRRFGVRVMFDPNENSAESRGILRRYISVGPVWLGLTQRERHAVLLHEVHHHHRHHHASRWLLLSLFWVPFVVRIVHNQEFDADEFVVTQGYGADMIMMLRRYPAHDPEIDPFHPSPAERIERILARMRKELHAAT